MLTAETVVPVSRKACVLSPLMIYNNNGYGEYVKEKTNQLGWKMLAQATHGSLMNNDESLTPQDRLQLAPKQHYTQVQLT